MPYNPSHVSGIADVEGLRLYVEEELKKISAALNEQTAVDLRQVFRAPDRPREGMLVAADGTTWDPGSGAGVYEYVGAVWRRLNLPLVDATAFSLGQFSRDLTAASGAQAITGVGFSPKAVFAAGGVHTTDGGSIGWSNVASSLCIFNYNIGVAGSWGVSTGLLTAVLQAAAGKQQTGVLTSLDSDGFTITWTKSGSPTGTAVFGYLALR